MPFVAWDELGSIKYFHLEGTDITVALTTGTASASAFGFEPGNIVQEFGWGDDVDDALRSSVEDVIGSELVDEDYDDVTDGVITWWRADDGDTTDLTDLLVDVQAVLEDGGKIWLFSPKGGRSGHVAHHEIQEAASTAGLNATNTFSVAESWTATQLATRGRGR